MIMDNMFEVIGVPNEQKVTNDLIVLLVRDNKGSELCLKATSGSNPQKCQDHD